MNDPQIRKKYLGAGTPVDHVNVVILSVGQGSGQFIENCDSSKKLLSCILIDLGCEKHINELGQPAADWVTTRLKTMGSNSCIDAIFISHSDSDHINLIGKVLDSFVPVGTTPPAGKTNLSVKNVIYAGNEANYIKNEGTPQETNILKRLTSYMPANTKPEAQESFASSYYDQTPSPAFAMSPVFVYVLMANALSPDNLNDTRNHAHDKNTVSLVLAVELWDEEDSEYYIITGDATGVTIAECVDVMKSHKNFHSKILNGNVTMLSIPHHGSETSMFCFKNPKPAIRTNADALTIIDDFAKFLKAKTLTCSADKVSAFRHPSAFLMRLFYPYLAPNTYYSDPNATLASGHYYTAYFTTADGIKYPDPVNSTMQVPWPSEDNWYVAQTTYNIYTLDYYNVFYAFIKNSTKKHKPKGGKAKHVTTTTGGLSPTYYLDNMLAVPYPGQANPLLGQIVPKPASSTNIPMRVNWVYHSSSNSGTNTILKPYVYGTSYPPTFDSIDKHTVVKAKVMPKPIISDDEHLLINEAFDTGENFLKKLRKII